MVLQFVNVTIKEDGDTTIVKIIPIWPCLALHEPLHCPSKGVEPSMKIVEHPRLLYRRLVQCFRKKTLLIRHFNMWGGEI